MIGADPERPGAAYGFCYFHARLGFVCIVASFEAEADALFALAICRASTSLSAIAAACTHVPSRSSDAEADTAYSSHSKFL